MGPHECGCKPKQARRGLCDAIGVFEDDRALTIEDMSTSEQRFKTLGTDFMGRLLVVVYAYRDERIRLISARKATAPQRDVYERKRQ